MKHNKGRVATIIIFGTISLVGLACAVSFFSTLAQRIALIVIVIAIVDISHLIRDEYMSVHSHDVNKEKGGI